MMRARAESEMTQPLQPLINTGKSAGISGLFVADNSALPSTGAENMTLTTIALAIRTADYIARRNG